MKSSLVLPTLSFAPLLAGLLLSSGAALAQPAAATATTAGDGTVVLNPFDVTTSGTKGYMATNTISGTAMNTPLKDVPMTINVITSEFLDDSLTSGALTDALAYNSSITQTNRQPIANRNDSWSIRGFRNRNTLVDGVTAGEFVPTQMIDRIEVVKGPNTLYGQSDPGGLINIITKRPQGKDRLTVTQKAGNDGFFSTDLDANVVALQGAFGLRLLGSHNTTDGYKVVDGRENNFVGVAGDYRLAEHTRVLFHLSGNRTEGIPVQRGTYSFQLIPTDLNNDGDTLDTVNGIPEATVRYNNNFLPWNYTAQTGKNIFTNTTSDAQIGLRQDIGSNLNLQYTFVRTAQDMNMTFREYNTFDATGSSDANHTASSMYNRTDAHTFNALFTLPLGAFTNHLLAGARYTYDLDRSANFALRTLGNAAEKAALANMIAAGRKIRLFLTRADVLGGVHYWEDDVPTEAELKSLGTRTTNVDHSETRVGSLYLTDSVSTLNNRLKILGGIRYIRIRSQSTDITGLKIGAFNDQSKASYQGGAVYDLTSKLSAFANYATAFNPNGTNPNTGTFYDPETSKAYEGGLKFDGLWGGRINGSVAYFNIKKSQVVRSDYNPFTFKNDTEVTDDESKGYEAELFLDLLPGWQTVLNYSHIEAETVKSATLAKGLRLEGATPNRFTLWTSYGFQQGALKGFRFGGGMILARGPIQQFGTSNSRYVVENGYTTYSGFARYPVKIAKHTLTLGVNVDNITNVFYVRSRAGTNDPRQTVFSAAFEF